MKRRKNVRMTETDSSRRTLNYLIQLAGEVANAFKRGDDVTVSAVYDSLCEQSTTASHHVLDLYSVALAFLRIVLREHAGVAARAVRIFLRDAPGASELLLEALTAGAALATPDRQRVAKPLLDAGVLRDVGDGRYDVSLRHREMVRDLSEPHSVRVWRSVEQARHVARTSANPVNTIAGYLGITVREAQDFLRHFPLD